MLSTTPIVNEFLDLASEDKITNLKLVKLCYIAQGLSLALLDKPLFSEVIEAWQYGPVVPSVYHEFKHFRDQPITEKSVEYINGIYSEIKLKDIELKNIVKLAWVLYKDTNAEELVDITHQPGTPWSLTYVPNKNKEIDNVLMKVYFLKYVENLKKAIA